MITAIAIDDEPEAIDIIKFHASKFEDLDLLATFYKPQEAIDYLRHNPVDLLFLDVNMPGISGIELLKQLKQKPLIVFTTAYQKYAVESYKFEAVDYLLKPIDFEDFQSAIRKVKKVLTLVAQSFSVKKFVFIKDGTKTIKLFYDDIIFLKGSGNYVEFKTEVGRFSSRITIAELLKKLPATSFQRVHNSYIVNLTKIDRVEHNHISLGEHKIAVGENYRKAFAATIKHHLI